VPDSNEEFLARLLETFKLEAREHLNAISSQLDEMARAPPAERVRAVEVAFREAHSLKAAAHAVSQREIGRLCQSMEGAFAALKRGELESGSALLVALQGAADAASDLLDAVGSGFDPAQTARAAALADTLEAMRKGAPAPGADGPPAEAAAVAAPPPPVAAGTIRLSVHRLDALLLQAEEMLPIKIAAREQVAALNEALAALADWRRAWQRTVAAQETKQHALAAVLGNERQTRQGDSLPGLMEWNIQRISRLEAALSVARRRAASHEREAGVKVDRLLENVKRVLMLECRSLLDMFPKVVRDLAREQGKEVDLQIEGAELEIDRRILEELKDPLLHLVRNCVDHGVEKPPGRSAAGKPARATIRISAAQRESDKVEITVADDGAGVSLKRLAASAIKQGLLPAERAPSAGEAELLPLMFQSGVSTAPMITDLSGRGLGLAIVREKVERLGGTVEVETREGRGTTFRLLVPLTLATFRGIVVRVADHNFVIPTLGIERVLSGRRDDVRTVEDRPMLAVKGTHLPFVKLADVLEIVASARPAEADSRFLALVLGSSAMRVAFEVDEVHGDREVLIKPLGRTLERVRNVLGATVLADVGIAPILNVHDLLKSALRVARAPVSAAISATARAAQERRVLIVEDSITARGLLKNILEAAGYQVQVAVDGVEAWGLLCVEPFDVVVSDVEMPRMNGFDLTARIRADRRLAELPVVLVTALDSREDRERGVDVGANAYIVKRDFDQERLFEVLQRLS
jgi:two-component system chemotaxis sensor kinase CheA